MDSIGVDRNSHFQLHFRVFFQTCSSISELHSRMVSIQDKTEHGTMYISNAGDRTLSSQEICEDIWWLEQSAIHNSSSLFFQTEGTLSSQVDELNDLHETLLLDRTFYTKQIEELNTQPVLSVQANQNKVQWSLWDLGQQIISATRAILKSPFNQLLTEDIQQEIEFISSNCQVAFLGFDNATMLEVCFQFLLFCLLTSNCSGSGGALSQHRSCDCGRIITSVDITDTCCNWDMHLQTKIEKLAKR